VQSNHPSIYQSETNPYIVRLSTDSPIGQVDVSSAGTSGDINFWLDCRAYNMIEGIHQLWLLAICDLIIGKKEYSVS